MTTVEVDPDRLWLATSVDVVYATDGEIAAVNPMPRLILEADDALDAARQAAAIVQAVLAQLMVLDGVRVVLETTVQHHHGGAAQCFHSDLSAGTTEEV